MAIALEDFCKIDTNEVREASSQNLAEDPRCPRDALLRSPAVYDPNDPTFNRLAEGDIICAHWKHWDEGSLYDDPTPGLGCPEDCIKPDLTDEFATLVTWSQCVEEDALVRFCRNANEGIDPFALVISLYEDIRDYHRQCYLLAMLRGQYNAVVAAETATPGVTGLLCDFNVASADGTSDISVENMAAATGKLVVEVDSWIVSHSFYRKLRASNFAVCCDQNGDQQSRIPELVAPGGETIIPMDKKYDPLFDLGQGKFLMIGLKDRSIAMRDGNPAQGSDLFRSWNPLQFNDPSASGGCDSHKLYIRDRKAMHTCGFSYSGPKVRCAPDQDKAFFMQASNWEYPHVVREGCGWEQACAVFLCGTCPTLLAPVEVAPAG